MVNLDMFLVFLFLVEILSPVGGTQRQYVCNCACGSNSFHGRCQHVSLIGMHGPCPYTCDNGYSGYCCRDKFNVCPSSPCQHDGVCNHKAFGMIDHVDIGIKAARGLSVPSCECDLFSTCTCTLGYTGSYCETDINECASSPCQHGGVCHDAVNEFTCTCTAGYSGNNCEIDINECASSPCQHGGMCHDAVNEFTCTCTEGYRGKTCEIVNECSSNPCQNNGVCIDRMNGYTCNCAHGYGGISCQYDISECHSSPCVNGGVCNDMVNGYNCSCPRGYTGRHCQTEPTVKIAPRIILDVQKTVDEGTDVYYIPCYAEGIPLPTIIWDSIEKPSLPSNSRQLVDFLIFKNVTTSDSGLYMCTAKNEMGSDIKVVHVIVKAKPQKLHTAPLIYALSMVQVNYYGDARLVCNVTGYPAPFITWNYDNKVLQSSGNILVVHNVTNTTSGYYTCIATNDAGTSQANILLKVIYDVPQIVKPPKTALIMTGHSHNFTCVATGHPSPSIKWSFKSFTQQSTAMPSHQLHLQGSLLTLFALKTHESGTLSCKAHNEFGDDIASVAVVFRNPSISGLG